MDDDDEECWSTDESSIATGEPIGKTRVGDGPPPVGGGKPRPDMSGKGLRRRRGAHDTATITASVTTERLRSHAQSSNDHDNEHGLESTTSRGPECRKYRSLGNPLTSVHKPERETAGGNERRPGGGLRSLDALATVR